jgi:AcrR family transcriptional regulator
MEPTTNATELPLGVARPGGRTARSGPPRRAATLAELAEHGFAGLTVEGVAARAGVHKTTVYRRWGTAAALAVDALDAAGDEPWPVPDTGDVREDLRRLCRLVVDSFADPESGPVSRAFVAAATHSPATATALHRFLAGRHDQAAAIVRRAIARGDLPPTTDPVDTIRTAIAPLYYRLFISGEPVDTAIADRAADTALAAARATPPA